MDKDYGAAIEGLSRTLDRLQLQITALAKACKVSLDYKPHDYEVNALPEDDEGLNG